MPYEPLLAARNEAQFTSQDLPQLVRELYREIVSYHRRQEAIKLLQDSANVESGESGESVETNEVNTMHVEAQEVRVE